MLINLLSEEEAKECIPPEYCNRVNKTPNQKKIKKRLEELGHKHVFVWWEPVGVWCEMMGADGGYMCVTDHECAWPLGYSYDEAMESLNWKTHDGKFLYQVS